MRCRVFRGVGMVDAIGFVCGAPPPRCSTPGCRGDGTQLCDWKLTGAKAGKTCDARICKACAVKPAPDKDLCPPHNRAWERWKAERAAKGTP